MRIGRVEDERLGIAGDLLETVQDAIEDAREEQRIEIHDLRSMARLCKKAAIQLETLAGGSVDDGD